MDQLKAEEALKEINRQIQLLVTNKVCREMTNIINHLQEAGYWLHCYIEIQKLNLKTRDLITKGV